MNAWACGVWHLACVALRVGLERVPLERVCVGPLGHAGPSSGRAVPLVRLRRSQAGWRKRAPVDVRQLHAVDEGMLSRRLAEGAEGGAHLCRGDVLALVAESVAHPVDEVDEARLAWARKMRGAHVHVCGWCGGARARVGGERGVAAAPRPLSSGRPSGTSNRRAPPRAARACERLPRGAVYPAKLRAASRWLTRPRSSPDSPAWHGTQRPSGPRSTSPLSTAAHG
eukprot:7383833-Prymnesium_polylepis.1